MRVVFVERDSAPERLVCEAEVVFEAEAGPLAGMKLVGFSLWRSPEGEVYVTFPSRAFGAGNERRFFDFLRSVDMLIWALFFTRGFGPGPLAGMSAIFFTDTGTLGKLYSEALENIDDKQREGIRSVGASPVAVQRLRSQRRVHLRPARARC